MHQQRGGSFHDGLTEVKVGELWLSSTTHSGPLGVLIYNAENSNDEECGFNAYEGRQHVMMPLDQITHSNVVFAKQRHPSLLVLAAMTLVFGTAGGLWHLSSMDDTPISYYLLVIIGVLLAACTPALAYMFSSKTQMMAKFVSPSQEIAVYWDIVGLGPHADVAGDNFHECAAYRAVWQVEEARMALLAARR